MILMYAKISTSFTLVFHSPLFMQANIATFSLVLNSFGSSRSLLLLLLMC